MVEFWMMSMSQIVLSQCYLQNRLQQKWCVQNYVTIVLNYNHCKFITSIGTKSLSSSVGVMYNLQI